MTTPNLLSPETYDLSLGAGLWLHVTNPNVGVFERVQLVRNLNRLPTDSQPSRRTVAECARRADFTTEVCGARVNLLLKGGLVGYVDGKGFDW